MFHQRRIDPAANWPVPAPVPTFTQPVLAVTSYTPYGTALPRSLSAKSCTFTLRGVPAGSHSAPPLAKLPTSSFFFVSTEMTGSAADWNAGTCALMYRNWASRSGCCFPSTVLALPCRL